MTLLYDYITKKGHRNTGALELPEASLQEFFDKGESAPLATAISESGFPPKEWAMIMNCTEVDLYNKDAPFISEEEFNTMSKKIASTRRERAMILDCI